MSRFKIVGKGKFIQRKGGTFYFSHFDETKKILYRPFIQFSTKEPFWYPHYKRQNENIWYFGWLFVYVGVVTCK